MKYWVVLFATFFLIGCSSKQKVPKNTAKVGIDPAVIRAVIGNQLPQIRKCHQNKDSKIYFEGIVRSNFLINKKGNVEKINFKSEKPLGEIFETCLKNQFKKLKFPKPAAGGTVEVNQPFNFYAK